MKPTLKTTALAMCIALSLTACKSTSNFADARPTPVQPAATQPAEAKPDATQPAATQPAEAKPAATQPAEAKPDATQPAATQPAEAKPDATQPAATQPAEAKPDATQPAATQPAEAKPDATQPAATQPAEAKPAEAKPDVTQPAASSYDDLKKLFYRAVVDGKSSDLVDATYKGKVFAKVKLSNTDEERYAQTTTDEDGDVTLNVQKNSSDKFKMSGTINSKTVGSINLGEKEIIENKVKDGHVDFGDDADGKYSATISKNGDIVGRVEYNSRRAAEEGFYPSFEGKDGATKYLFGYEAFFDATKQPK
ncbi:hypothetical protein [Haemophilus haemolyticus]|uniref:hypothetical protein n=1 Tax=Haemophilus haemolyticus TaxID=726 RepID=UPI000E56AD2A|nr:hypothetical protein [Haemophilus haemolyticus]